MNKGLKVLPFKGYFFNCSKSKSLRDFIAPPYDVIPEEEKERFNFTHNITRLTLSWEEGDYEKRGALLRNWLEREVIISDEYPCFYLYHHYYLLHGEKKLRRGFFSLVELRDFQEGVILPHEETLSRPKEDRLKVLRATQAHLEPIFFLYSDRSNAIIEKMEEKREEVPLFDFEDREGQRHILWRVKEKETLEWVEKKFQDKKLYIADGHHRYETSLLYRKENPKFKYILGYLTCMDNEGLTILPAHRLLRNVGEKRIERLWEEGSKYFHIFQVELSQAFSLLQEKGRNHHVYLLVRRSHPPFLLVSRSEKKIVDDMDGHSPVWKKLDVSVLHSLIFEEIMGMEEKEFQDKGNLIYVMERERALQLIQEGIFEVGFFLNPTHVEEVRKVAEKREKMPGKATYFYPKVPSGLLFYIP